MTRYVVSAKFGVKDTHRPLVNSDERHAQMAFLNESQHLRYGLDDILKCLKRLKLKPTSVGFDFLVLATMVHSADTRVNRIQTSQDAWTRELRLVVPVLNHHKWIRATDVLQRMLRFLTGDLWSIDFRPWPSKVKAPISDGLKLTTNGLDSISLFSGGLDSLIGAIDHLENGAKTLFVSHGGESTVSKLQSDLFDELQKQFVGRANVDRIRWGLRFQGQLYPDMKGESSTRGRSFLFFSLAVAAGTSLRKDFTIRVPENGLIALNVPLDVTRLGSNSTRTTHPFYMHRWNELLSILEIPGALRNPYWNRTKGEMVSGCLNEKTLKALAPISMSCAHPSQDRYIGSGKPHCGYCLPCIIRRASFMSSWGKDPTGYQIDLTKDRLVSTAANGQQIRAFQYALSRLAADPDVAQSLVFKPGPLREDSDIIPDLVDVYRRGMGEVAKVVGGLKVYSEG